MSVRVHVPAYLRSFAKGRSTVELGIADASVQEILAELRRQFPGVVARILDEQGAVRQHVNLFVGQDNTRDLDGLATRVPAGAELFILPSVTGG